MNTKEPKYRHEFKYLISTAQIPLLKGRIENIMQRDPHVDENGYYNIRSLYFDDYHNRYYYENEHGTDPREKFRIRIYNHSSEKISLECKRKEHGKTLKTSCKLTKEQTELIINGKSLPYSEKYPPLLKKFIILTKAKGLRPVIIVEYERIPYIYKNGNVRVTFDTRISSSSDITDFLSGSLSKRPIMPVNQQLLEVKFDEYLPDFIYNNLNLGTIHQTTFSKYYLCRKYSLHI